MESSNGESSGKLKYGGTTCCVQFCKSNSVRNPELSFHKFPKDLDLRETWLNLLCIDRQPLKSHKVCSLHFPGGKKSYGALPTVQNVSSRQTVNSSKGRAHTNITEQQNTISPESNDELLRAENAELKQKLEELSTKYKQRVLRIEHVLASNTNFKFYTGFQDYQTFKAFFELPATCM